MDCRHGNLVDSTSGSNPNLGQRISLLDAMCAVDIGPSSAKALWRKERRHRIHRPDEGSLYDILHKHAGTQLFVPPPHWTDMHMKLLGVQWEELSPCDTPRPIASPCALPSRGHMAPSKTVRSLSNNLTRILPPHSGPSVVSGAIETVLETLWPNTFSKLPCRSGLGLDLHFGSCIFPNLVTPDLMWNLSSEDLSCQSSPISSPNRPPVICYIDKTHLTSARNSYYRIKPGPQGSPNKPVVRLNRLKARKFVPSNPNRDPCFVGIFLTMAQRHFYPHLPAKDRKARRVYRRESIPSSFQDLQLRILTHDTDTDTDMQALIVYTANMTKEFLHKFHDPFKALPDDNGAAFSGLEIKYTRVSIWPILGLRERLGKAFGQDVVGPFNADEMETWVTDQEEPDNGKHKRKAAKSSLGEDPADEPTLAAKKHRWSGEVSADVVM